MRGHTHALFGLTTLVVVNSLTNFIQPHLAKDVPVGLVACAGAAILGALAPDIDAEDSSIKRELGLAGSAASLGLKLAGVKHRGLTHSGLATVLVSVVAWLFARSLGYGDVGLAFGLGYLSHVAIADAMTIHGVPLLWPLPGRFHLLPRLLRIRTGGAVETVIFVVVAVELGLLLPAALPPELFTWLKHG